VLNHTALVILVVGQINRQVHSIDGLYHPIPGVGIVPYLYRGVTR
jgi:hypothetical protein